MRFYTKEWSSLMDSLGVVDMFRPVIDKEYTDEEIEALYDESMDIYVEQEREIYDEPPHIIFEEDEDDEDDDDDIDEDDDIVISIDELLDEYENREPFDEEEARSEFEENYKDALEEPDEDIPAWITECVDPRLIAMGVLPEGAYKKLMAEEKKLQERFDELDAAADEALEDMYASMPDEYTGILDDFDELDGDYVIGIEREGDELCLMLYGWDEDAEPVKRTVTFDGVSIIEDEGITIDCEIDEDGDYMSNCDLSYHEIYFENDRFEVHMLFDDGEQKYLTLSCDGISIEQSRVQE
jgi:hypothetical protein